MHCLVNFHKDVSYIEQILICDKKHFSPGIRLIVKAMQKSNPSLIRALTFDYNEELQFQFNGLSQNGFFPLQKGSFFVWKSLDDSEVMDAHNLFLNRLFTQGNV